MGVENDKVELKEAYLTIGCAPSGEIAFFGLAG